MNLGLENAGGNIIAFIDDDAIPSTDWIQNHVEPYALPNVGGVAGNVIPVASNGKRIVPIEDASSEVIPALKPFLPTVGRRIWSCPIEGLEDYLIYISKAARATAFPPVPLMSQYSSTQYHLAAAGTLLL